MGVVPFEANIKLTGDAGEYYSAQKSFVFKDIPIGEYKIEIKQDGYKSYKKTLQLPEGETVKEIVTLEKGSDAPEGFVLIEAVLFRWGMKKVMMMKSRFIW